MSEAATTKQRKQSANAPTNGANAPSTTEADQANVANITIAAAAKIADVSPVTMRNAVKNHEAFKVAGAQVKRNMRDEFGNETDHPTTYLTRAAIDAYIEARKSPSAKRGFTKSNDPKRRVLRLTDEETAAYTAGDYATAFARKPAIEAPQTRTKKAKSTDTPSAATATASPAPDAATAQTVDTSAQSTLFDVALTAGAEPTA